MQNLSLSEKESNSRYKAFNRMREEYKDLKEYFQKGKTFEDIARLLNEDKVFFFLFRSPETNKQYFRRSLLLVSQNNKQAAIQALGESDHFNVSVNGRDRHIYYAMYSIGLLQFFNDYDGQLTFNEGALVEKTEIDYVTDLENIIAKKYYGEAENH